MTNKYRIIAYMSDECMVHQDPKKCLIDGRCYLRSGGEDLDTLEEAESLVDMLLTYGYKHQCCSLYDVTVEKVGNDVEGL